MALILSMIYFVRALKVEDRCNQLNLSDYLTLVEKHKLSINLEKIKEQFNEINQTPVNKIEMLYPNSHWVEEENKFLLAVRIFINYEESFIYLSYYEKNWTQIESTSNFNNLVLPRMLKINTPEDSNKPSGPEDPRLFISPKNGLFLIFNMLDHDRKRKMNLFSLKIFQIFPLTLKNYSQKKINGNLAFIIPEKEKNWAPLIIDDKILFVYNLKHFQVIDCTSKSVCDHIVGKYSNDIGKIKPGSAYVRFNGTDFYFSFSFKHLFCPKNYFPFYRPSLDVIYANNKKIEHIYNSEAVHIFDPLGYTWGNNEPPELKNYDLCRRQRILIISHISNIDYDLDITEILGYAEDVYLFRAKIKGLKTLLERIIDDYKISQYKYFEIYN